MKFQVHLDVLDVRLQRRKRTQILDNYSNRESALEYCVFARNMVAELWKPDEYRYGVHSEGTMVDLYDTNGVVEFTYTFSIRESNNE